MTPDTRKLLLTLISAYGDSLTRIDGEKDQMKALTERAETEGHIDPSAFKRAALAYYKDQVAALRENLESQLDLLDTLKGAPE